ncbi:MAG: hypothetical protein P8Y37_13865, partial [Anaerolineales bacterium]
DVDVIADAGAVRGGVVGPVDLDPLALSERDLEHKRNEMGFGLMGFALAGESPGGVEIAQGGVAQAEDLAVEGQHLLDHQLGVAVDVGRPQRAVLAEGIVRGLVDGGGGAERSASPRP